MTREEAIEVLKKKAEYLESDKRFKAAVETLIPELAESEDERIRKRLIEYFEGFMLGKANVKWEGLCVEGILAWLEKQKYNRMQPVYDNQESFESALDKAWKSYNDCGARTVDSCEDDYVECAHAKGFREGFLFGVEMNNGELGALLTETYKSGVRDGQKQKEQKSVECSEEEQKYNEILDWARKNKARLNGVPIEQELSKMMVHKAPYLAPVPTPMVADEQKPVKASGKLSRRDYLYQLLINQLITYSDYEYLIGQKPAKWSEKFIADVFEKVGLAKIVREQGNDGLTNALQAAMIELSKVGNTEWSKEDEEKLERVDDLLWMLDDYLGDDCSICEERTARLRDEIQKELCPWLKSLRSRPKSSDNWEPGEDELGKKHLEDYFKCCL